MGFKTSLIPMYCPYIQYIIDTHVLTIYMGLMGFNTSLIPMYCPYIQYTIDTHVLSMYIYISIYGINGIQYIINTHVLSIYSIHH